MTKASAVPAARTAPPAPTVRAHPRSATSRPTMQRQPTRRVLIVDRRNMLKLWLEEKMARRELTPAQADAMLREQESGIKNWVSPFKDAAGSAQLLYKMAHDFGSWKGAKVSFSRNAAGHELVTFKGWPNGRKMIRGTRYRVDHPKMIELQIGKPGLRASARESARFGVYLVVAVDVADYLLRDKATLGGLLGALTVDIPGVLLASAVGAAAGSAVAGTAIGTALVVGSFAMGPLVVAFAVGFLVGVGLTMLDNEFHISEKLGKAYDAALDKLAGVWDDLSDEAESRYRQLANSQFVHDLEQNADRLRDRIARQADLVSGKLAQLW